MNLESVWQVAIDSIAMKCPYAEVRVVDHVSMGTIHKQTYFFINLCVVSSCHLLWEVGHVIRELHYILCIRCAFDALSWPMGKGFRLGRPTAPHPFADRRVWSQRKIEWKSTTCKWSAKSHIESHYPKHCKEKRYHRHDLSYCDLTAWPLAHMSH